MVGAQHLDAYYGIFFWTHYKFVTVVSAVRNNLLILGQKNLLLKILFLLKWNIWMLCVNIMKVM